MFSKIIKRKIIFVFFPIFLLSANGEVKITKEIYGNELIGVTLENEILQVKITRKAGKVISFVDKRTNHNFVSSENILWSGFCKERDWAVSNVEPILANYSLKVIEESPEKCVVEAKYQAETGNFAGLEFRKIYTIQNNKSYLKVNLIITGLEKKNLITLNIHNSLSLENFPPETSYYYLKSREGLVKTSVAERGNNIVYSPDEPWIGLVNEKTKEGLVCIVKNKEDIDNFYFWIGEKTSTIEWAYQEKSLVPMAEMDKLETEYYLIPTYGLSSYYYASLDLIYSVIHRNNTLTFSFISPDGIGKTEISVFEGNKRLIKKILFLTNNPNSFSFPEPEVEGIHNLKINLKTEYKTLSFDYPIGVNKPIPFAQPTHEIIKKKMEGIKGFYYYFNKLYISPDISVPVSFGLMGDFPKDSNLKMILEIPEGIEITYRFKEERLKYSKENIFRKGERYIRYIFPSPRYSSYYQTIQLIISTRLNKNEKELNAYYYAVWDSGRQPEQVLPIEIIRIDKTPSLKKLRIGVELNPELINVWSNFCSDYTRVGMNFLSIFPYTAGNFLCAYLGKNKYKDLVEELNKNGIETTVNLGGTFPYYDHVLQKHPFYYKGACTLYHPEEYKEFDVEEVKAVNINGEKILSICPSYRGRYFDKIIDIAKTAIDYGFTSLLYDEETWSNGFLICYCDRCKMKFKEFLKKNYPNLEYVDPQLFEKDPSSYIALDNAWWDFKTSMVEEIYQEIKSEVNNYAKMDIKIGAYIDAGVGEGRYGAIRSRLTDYKKLSKPLDFLVPMLYTSENQRVGELVVFTSNNTGKDADPFIALSPARTYEYERVASQNLPPAIAIKYQILEAFTAGAKGILIWAPLSCLEGALSYKYISEAIRMIAPVEHIIYNGKPLTNIYSSNPGVHVRGTYYQDEAVIFVAEYSREPVTTEIKYKVDKKRDVCDLFSGEIIAQISPANPVFKITIDKERVRLFYIKKGG